MAKYVDGFVVVVPRNHEKEYIKMAEEGREVWMKHGALEYFECKGDDLVPKDMGGGKAREFPEMVSAKENEDVWFSFIIYKSKEHRDEVNKKVMAEMDEKYKDHPGNVMAFDIKRMAYGGFEVRVEG